MQGLISKINTGTIWISQLDSYGYMASRSSDEGNLVRENQQALTKARENKSGGTVATAVKLQPGR